MPLILFFRRNTRQARATFTPAATASAFVVSDATAVNETAGSAVAETFHTAAAVMLGEGSYSVAAPVETADASVSVTASASSSTGSGFVFPYTLPIVFGATAGSYEGTANATATLSPVATADLVVDTDAEAAVSVVASGSTQSFPYQFPFLLTA